MKNLILFLFALSLLLAACAPKTTPTEAPAPAGGYPAQEQPAQPASEVGYPVGGSVDIQLLPPQAGDEALTRAEVILASTQLLTSESNPAQYRLRINGSLPTPCYQARVEVASPDAGGKIVVQLYALASPEQTCAQVIQPFTADLDLGSFTKGSYSLELNGQTVTSFDAP